MAVAFLQALLKMLHTEIESFDKPRPVTADAPSTKKTVTENSPTSDAPPKDASTSGGKSVAAATKKPRQKKKRG
jgi:hypothetical protein